MSLHFEICSDIENVDAELWNRLAFDAGPMMEWEYFYCMEKSGAVSQEKGYRTRHLLAYLNSELVGIAPLYERDRAWVEFGDGGLIEFLSEMTGFPYQQGFVGTLPFTPVPAYQFLVRRDVDEGRMYQRLLNYIDYMSHKRDFSTSRIYFLDPAPYQLHTCLLQQGYICIRSEHYLWRNHGYQDFNDYLKVFKSNRRTKIKRELRDIRNQGVILRMAPGSEAPESYYRRIFEAYLQTWTKYMGPYIHPFLNEDFFRLLGERFAHRTEFSVAEKDGQLQGMALFYRKNDRLFGRYWGAFKEIPFLHFATCYYYPIQYAIEEGIQVVDPGFGGEHKLRRGFEVVPAFHYIKFYGERKRRVAYSILEQMKSSSTSFSSFKGRP